VDFYTDASTDPNCSEFRISDPIATLQGNRSYAFFDHNVSTTTYVFDRTYEAQRQKYSSADPGLEEYEVVQTRGGNWMNYTRTFPADSHYNIYLRHACAASQNLGLDQIAPGPVTNNLGTFSATNALWVNHYRYAPLRDHAGQLAVASLSGTNTLRLTVLGPDSNPTRYGLSLNYLAFVPAVLVESASQVGGPYSLETNALVEPGIRHITIPQNGTARFYRLRWDHAVRISSIKAAGNNVELTYQ